MKDLSRRSLLSYCAAALPVGAVLSSGTESAWAAPKTQLPVFPPATRKGPRANYFPNFLLQTQDGKKVRFYDDLMCGKTVLINFFYAECEKFCPGMTANLVKVQKLLGERAGRDIFMYSLTLEPRHDTPKVLKEYARNYHVKPGWLFLTGKPDEMEVLRRKLGFVDPDPELDKDRSEHIGVVLYGNEKLNTWSACPALTNPSEMVREVSWVEWPKRQTHPAG